MRVPDPDLESVLQQGSYLSIDQVRRAADHLALALALSLPSNLDISHVWSRIYVEVGDGAEALPIDGGSLAGDPARVSAVDFLGEPTEELLALIPIEAPLESAPEAIAEQVLASYNASVAQPATRRSFLRTLQPEQRAEREFLYWERDESLLDHRDYAWDRESLSEGEFQILGRAAQSAEDPQELVWRSRDGRLIGRSSVPHDATVFRVPSEAAPIGSEDERWIEAQRLFGDLIPS